MIDPPRDTDHDNAEQEDNIAIVVSRISNRFAAGDQFPHIFVTDTGQSIGLLHTLLKRMG